MEPRLIKHMSKLIITLVNNLHLYDTCICQVTPIHGVTKLRRRIALVKAGPSDRAVQGVGRRSLACWDCGFESRRRYGCLSVVVVACCLLEVSASGRSLSQRSPTGGGVSECDRGTSQRRPRPTRVVEPRKKNNNIGKKEHILYSSQQLSSLEMCDCRFKSSRVTDVLVCYRCFVLSTAS